jgi:rubredoxin
MAQKYQCTICRYIYGRKRDPDSKITPGTSFADLGDMDLSQWRHKDDFKMK